MAEVEKFIKNFDASSLDGIIEHFNNGLLDLSDGTRELIEEYKGVTTTLLDSFK
jgi:hypothetical protein